jgi:DNA-binding XRE family transcriptional regulator
MQPLARIMDLRSINDADLARAVGCNKSSINAWKSGRQEPRSNAVISLARVLKVSSDELFGFTPPLFGTTLAVRYRELHRSISKHGEYDSHTLHLWAAAFDRDREGRFRKLSLWLRDVAEAVYKIELLAKPEVPTDHVQLRLF